MGRSVKCERSAKLPDRKNPQESSVASDEGSDPSTSSKCSCISSSTCSTHYRDFSTMSSSNRGGRQSQNDDQFVMQNMSNKRNERLQKPCRDGFCYCFTSDTASDVPPLQPTTVNGNGMAATKSGAKESDIKPRFRHKRSHSEKIDHIRPENRLIHKHVKHIDSRTRRRITLPPSTEIKLTCDPRDEKCSKHNPKHTFVSKYTLPEPLSSEIDEPLVRIIQEIHKNFVVSKICVNKGKIRSQRKKENHTPTAPFLTTQIEEPEKIIHLEARNIDNSKLIKETNPIESKTLEKDEKPAKNIDDNPTNVPIRPPRSPKKKGGHLLRKRIGDNTSFKQSSMQNPPRKPPRSFSSASESNITGKSTKTTSNSSNAVVKENIVILQDHSSPSKLTNTMNGQEFPNKSAEQPSPSCPNMSEITFAETPNKLSSQQDPLENQIGWVRQDVANMLNYESQGKTQKEFQSFQNSAQPQTFQNLHLAQPQTFQNIAQTQTFQNIAQPQALQNIQQAETQTQTASIGWRPPHKLDIDTVDNVPKFRDNGFHNFAANMELKSTPVKNELVSHNASKMPLKQQVLNKSVCTCPVKQTDSPGGKKLSPIYESKKDSNFGTKAVNNTKNFWTSSRKKIVALVRRKSIKNRKNFGSMKSIGIQTSEPNLTEINPTKKALFSRGILDDSFTHLGSRFNPIDKVDAISSIHSQSKEKFDFNRVVNSPKAERSFTQKFSPAKMLKTLGQRTPQQQQQEQQQAEHLQSYKSYDTGVNGDFAVTAMNDILLNLRSRLEADDDHMTIERFDEIGRDARDEVADGGKGEEIDNKNSSTQISAQVDIHPEPVYAEIKERQPAATVTCTDQGVQTVEVLSTTTIVSRGPQDSTIIYAEVDKSKKFPKCDSFNNLSEKDSPPKNRNLNKTHLSSSSEKFLDNLFNTTKDNCSGEYIRIPLSSEDATSPARTSSTAPAEGLQQEEGDTDDVHYEEPFEVHEIMLETSYEKPSDYSRVTSPEFYPKDDDSSSHSSRQPKLPVCKLHKDNNNGCYTVDLPERSSSCPPSSKKSASRKLSLDSDDFEHVNLNLSTSNCKSPNTSFQKYRTLKDRFKMSFRRGKNYFKNDPKRFSIGSSGDMVWDQSDLGLSSLYAMDVTDQEAVQKQIEQAVNICRQLPQFESSTELVEAERLLLFSTLKSRSMKKLPSPSLPPPPPPSKTPSPSKLRDCILYVETFEIPIIPDVNHDTFFNYFYIGVFSNGTDIKSTHSAEKLNNRVVFRDCLLLFDNLEDDFQVKIDIYVLRLRKMTNAQRIKPTKKKNLMRSYNSSDSGDEILSRFRLHGTVILIPESFAPYKIHTECKRRLPNSKFCMSTSGRNFIFNISEITKSVHLLRELRMSASVELATRKIELEGFINVQDEKNAHNWNRRWCKLKIATLYFWDYPQDYTEKPSILQIDLTKCISFPIEIADASICAKQRSFLIKIIDKMDESIDSGTGIKEFFFSTENHAELTHWLSGLNQIGEFIKKWM